jgi:hypothetical protein
VHPRARLLGCHLFAEFLGGHGLAELMRDDAFDGDGFGVCQQSCLEQEIVEVASGVFHACAHQLLER